MINGTVDLVNGPPSAFGISPKWDIKIAHKNCERSVFPFGGPSAGRGRI